jgi:hypothetical protein
MRSDETRTCLRAPLSAEANAVNTTLPPAADATLLLVAAATLPLAAPPVAAATLLPAALLTTLLTAPPAVANATACVAPVMWWPARLEAVAARLEEAEARLELDEARLEEARCDESHATETAASKAVTSLPEMG